MSLNRHIIKNSHKLNVVGVPGFQGSLPLPAIQYSPSLLWRGKFPLYQDPSNVDGRGGVLNLPWKKWHGHLTRKEREKRKKSFLAGKCFFYPTHHRERNQRQIVHTFNDFPGYICVYICSYIWWRHGTGAHSFKSWPMRELRFWQGAGGLFLFKGVQRWTPQMKMCKKSSSQSTILARRWISSDILASRPLWLWISWVSDRFELDLDSV